MAPRFTEVSAALETRMMTGSGPSALLAEGGAGLRALAAGLYASTRNGSVQHANTPLSPAEVHDAVLADRLRAATGLLAVALVLMLVRKAGVRLQVDSSVRREEEDAKAHTD
jgi:hypothetical protein|tara:strand:- start:138 stop:473 length:336 start_codon:yes stop_codon:yes gene_type:complete